MVNLCRICLSAIKVLTFKKKKVAWDPRDPLLIQFLGAVLPLTQSSFI